MKEQIRLKALALRDSMDEADRRRKSALICERIVGLAEFKAADRVMTYASFGSEVATDLLVDLTLTAGKRLYLPLIDEGRRLLVGEITPELQLVTGPFGIQEPPRDSANLIDPELLDMIIVPGVAFDRSGFRIGYGGGYYDRFLPLLRDGVCTIGASFGNQLVETIPIEKYDQVVDLVVTESQIIDCR